MKEARGWGEKREPVPPEILTVIPNRHRATDGGTNYPPDIDHEDFVAYMPNQFGEQMIFVRREGSPLALLYHGDLAWAPAEVADGVTSGINLDESERAFIRAAWDASCFMYAPREAVT